MFEIYKRINNKEEFKKVVYELYNKGYKGLSGESTAEEYIDSTIKIFQYPYLIIKDNKDKFFVIFELEDIKSLIEYKYNKSCEADIYPKEYGDWLVNNIDDIAKHFKDEIYKVKFVISKIVYDENEFDSVVKYVFSDGVNKICDSENGDKVISDIKDSQYPIIFISNVINGKIYLVSRTTINNIKDMKADNPNITSEEITESVYLDNDCIKWLIANIHHLDDITKDDL